ncbi:MAG: hypothetical protein WC222_03255 [Parachlamydiales bacterium]|jgi:hypothetical protein
MRDFSVEASIRNTAESIPTLVGDLLQTTLKDLNQTSKPDAFIITEIAITCIAEAKVTRAELLENNNKLIKTSRNIFKLKTATQFSRAMFLLAQQPDEDIRKACITEIKKEALKLAANPSNADSEEYLFLIRIVTDDVDKSKPLNLFNTIARFSNQPELAETTKNFPVIVGEKLLQDYLKMSFVKHPQIFSIMVDQWQSENGATTSKSFINSMLSYRMEYLKVLSNISEFLQSEFTKLIKNSSTSLNQSMVDSRTKLEAAEPITTYEELLKEMSYSIFIDNGTETKIISGFLAK